MAESILETAINAVAECEALKRENAQIRQALKACIVPLEVLHADNGAGAKWMTPELREEVRKAVESIRGVFWEEEKEDV